MMIYGINENTKNYCTGHLQQMAFMVCKLNLKKAILEKGKGGGRDEKGEKEEEKRPR